MSRQKTLDQVIALRLTILWTLFLGLVVLASLGMPIVAGRLSHAERKTFLVNTAVCLFFSPLAFGCFYRCAIRWPRLILLTWWPIPLSAIYIGFKFTGDMGATGHMFAGMLLAVAGFWSMFTPVVVIGEMRRRSLKKQ